MHITIAISVFWNELAWILKLRMGRAAVCFGRNKCIRLFGDIAFGAHIERISTQYMASVKMNFAYEWKFTHAQL